METRNIQERYSAAALVSCSIHISEKPVYRKDDRTLLTWSSADRQRIVILRRSNGRLAVDIYDGRSRLWVRMLFFSSAALLFALLGEPVQLERIEASDSIKRELPSTLDWANLSLWLRGILPTFYEIQGRDPS